MNTYPLVSVIVCAYNAEKFLAETLQTLIDQTYPKVEIVVVDDGSTDGTSAIIQGFGAKLSSFYQPNAGLSAARNAGIQKSTGDLICFFDADDLMPPDRLSEQVDFLRRHPGIQMVICDYRNFSDQGQDAHTHFQTCPLLREQLQEKPEVVLEDACVILAQENFGIAGTPLLMRSLLDHVPSFENGLRSSEDFHFYYRLARHTKVGVLNNVGMLRRVHGNNMSSNWKQMLPNCIRSYSMLRDTESNPQAREYLNSQVAGFWMSLARAEANHRTYGLSLYHYWMALVTDQNVSQLYHTIYGVTRTLAIALGAHQPDIIDH